MLMTPLMIIQMKKKKEEKEEDKEGERTDTPLAVKEGMEGGTIAARIDLSTSSLRSTLSTVKSHKDHSER